SSAGGTDVHVWTETAPTSFDDDVAFREFPKCVVFRASATRPLADRFLELGVEGPASGAPSRSPGTSGSGGRSRAWSRQLTSELEKARREERLTLQDARRTRHELLAHRHRARRRAPQDRIPTERFFAERGIPCRRVIVDPRTRTERDRDRAGPLGADGGLVT